MDSKLPVLVTALCLLGCNTAPPPPAEVAAQPVAQLEPLANPAADPLVFERPLPPEPPGDPALTGRLCKLGTSCLDLDERPFEVCLVSDAKHCVEKGVELFPAQGQKPPESAAPLEVGKR